MTDSNLAITPRKQPKIFVVPNEKSAVNHRTVTKWFKKFCSVCKKFDDLASSAESKSVDSEDVLQALEADSTRRTRRVSGELKISVLCGPSPSQFLQKYPEPPNIPHVQPKYYKSFDL